MRSHFNTDKIWLHGYWPSYLEIAAKLGPSAKVLELGVLGGESLRMWQALFPTGDISGVDVNEKATWPYGTKQIITRQDDPHLADFGPFDLIVDDASHQGHLTRKSFRTLWPRVKPGGFYVIEDWFVGLEEYRDGAYDPQMLTAVQNLLLLLTKDGEAEEVTCRYGLAIARKKACA